MRSLALAEELASRDIEPVFFADTSSVPWVHGQLASRGFAVLAPPLSPDEHVDRFTSCGVDAVVFDSYLLPSQVYRAVRAAGLPTMAIVDGNLRDAEADLYLDQNIGAEHADMGLPEGSVRLAGLAYALLRDDVLSRRPSQPPVARDVEVPHLLAVFGGTDPFGAGPAAVEALAATRKPFDLTVVAPRDALRAKIAAIVPLDGQTVRIVGPTGRLAELVRAADVVVSAAGSSTWELLSLGACAALVCVADNQVPGYRRLVESGLVVGLGSLGDLRTGGRSLSEALGALLTDVVRRQDLAAKAWRSVDGRGRVRVADEFLRICTAHRGPSVR